MGLELEVVKAPATTPNPPTLDAPLDAPLPVGRYCGAG